MLKAPFVPKELSLPSNASAAPDWGHRMSTFHLPENGPRPTMGTDEPWAPSESWKAAHSIAAAEGIHLPVPSHAPQGLWKNHELMPIAEDGWRAGGHRWYRDYSKMLDAMASGSGIHRERLMDVYGLMGQNSDTPTNLMSTVKAFSRHLHGLYENPTELQRLQENGVIKSMATAEPKHSVALKVILGHGIDTKKLSAYSRSFRDSDIWHPHDSPHGVYGPVDEWIRRLFVGGQSSNEKKGGVSDAVAHAITGRSRSFLDHWHSVHPDRPLNGSMLQAMLWTGYKRRIASSMRQVADYIEANHSDKPNLMATVGPLRADANHIGGEGRVDETWDRFGMDPERGLPASASHGIVARYGKDVAALADSGAVHTDYHNHYAMSLPSKPGASVEDKRAAVARWREATGNEWGHVTDKGHLYLPKLKSYEYADSLKAHGIMLREEGAKGWGARVKAEPAKVTVRDQQAIEDFIHADPERAHALATLPITARHLESQGKKVKKAGGVENPMARLLWSDYGILMEHIGNEAARLGYGEVHPQPLYYGGYKNATEHDYSIPRAEHRAAKALGASDPIGVGGAATGSGGGQARHIRGQGHGGDGDGDGPAEGLKLPDRQNDKPQVTPSGVELPPAIRQLDDALALSEKIAGGIEHGRRALATMAERLAARMPHNADTAMARGALSVIADYDDPGAR